ncbi:MAG: glycosyltransferase [candidate division Zixibacteria bacterium]|nr:glycosyltransferase [candidate division Zixibacteria bacterium]
MQEYNILTIANLVPRKRIDLCAAACARMEKKHPLTWTVIGYGPLEEQIKKNAPKAMTFIGRVEDLVPYYRKADVFVLPSCDEGFGMVYVEAIMCRCPVVCRKDDGGQEIIDRTGGGLAIEIPPSDDRAADEIIRAIEKILDNKDSYISAEIIGKARQLVEPRAIKDIWEKLLGKYEKFLQ